MRGHFRKRWPLRFQTGRYRCANRVSRADRKRTGKEARPVRRRLRRWRGRLGRPSHQPMTCRRLARWKQCPSRRQRMRPRCVAGKLSSQFASIGRECLRMGCEKKREWIAVRQLTGDVESRAQPVIPIPRKVDVLLHARNAGVTQI